MADLTPKTIGELPSASTPADGDLFAISHSGTSKSISWSALKAVATPVSFTEGELAPGSSVDVACPAYEYGVIFVMSAASSKCCVVIYRSRNGSAITPFILGDHESITITPGINKITFSSGAGTAQTAYIKMAY